MSSAPVRTASDSTDAIASALDAAGCVVITEMMDPSQIAALRSELEPHMAAADTKESAPGDFYPGLTRRVTALVSRSETVRGLVVDPTVNALATHHLGANCVDHQLHVTAALEIGPGARKQVLHREEDPFSFFPLPRPNLVLASMWAITDFTAANGATLLVPGSHRWDAHRTYIEDEVVSAEMPAGSVLLWLGGTLHGAGANTTTDQWRYGVILTYSLGWLRQEENQYLDIPVSQLESLDPALLARTGHTMHEALGFYDPSVL